MNGMKGCRYVYPIILFLFGVATNISTVLNNAYASGSTLYDSAIFQTIIWRADWSLRPAPAVDDVSFFNIHFSPINYIPNILSYLYPFDRMSYYGVVYGAVYGTLLVVAFRLFSRIYRNPMISALSAALLYFGGPLVNGQWEPHQEIASALFMLVFFRAWFENRFGLVLAAIVLNAAVREDCGMLLALPLLGLAWTGANPENRRRLLLAAVLSALLSVAAFLVKKLYFNAHDVTSTFYYGSPPFGHLSYPLIVSRLENLILHEQFLWLPGVVLLIGALWLGERRLLVGWLAFLPYWLFGFLSIGELNSQLGSYKAFPFVLTLVWPAVIFAGAETKRRAYGVLQILLLLSASVAWEDGAPRFAAPIGVPALLDRWRPHPEIEQAENYRAFEAKLQGGSLGEIRASCGVLALYPYDFPIWYRSQVLAGDEAQAERLDSLLWFAQDRDEQATRQWLKGGDFPYYYRVIGTKMHLATRLPPEKLGVFAGAIAVEPIPQDY